MPLSLTNSCATFMSLINDIFRGHMCRFVVTYHDDILISSRSWEEHLQHVCTLLDLLRTHHLQVKERKSSFRLASVQYLGFVNDQEGICPDMAKVDALANTLAPVSIFEPLALAYIRSPEVL